MVLYVILVLVFYGGLAAVGSMASDAAFDGHEKNRTINAVITVGVLLAMCGLTYILKYAYYLGTIAV